MEHFQLGVPWWKGWYILAAGTKRTFKRPIYITLGQLLKESIISLPSEVVPTRIYGFVNQEPDDRWRKLYPGWRGRSAICERFVINVDGCWSRLMELLEPKLNNPDYQDDLAVTFSPGVNVLGIERTG